MLAVVDGVVVAFGVAGRAAELTGLAAADIGTFATAMVA